MLTLLSLALYAVGIVFFASWFVVANGLGRDTTPEGKLADISRRKRLKSLMIAGFVSLAAAIGLPSLLAIAMRP